MIHNLLIVAILAVVFSTAHKAYYSQNETCQISELLHPIKEYLSPNTRIAFIPQDSTELYYQSQFALAPAILSITKKRDTTLQISKSVYSPKPDEVIIVQYNKDQYFVCLKTTAK